MDQRTEQAERDQEEIAYLVKDIGLSPEEAERRLEDDDLWLLIPAQRFTFAPGEEDLGEWETAAGFAESLTDGFTDSGAINDATRQLLWDLRERSAEALRRARERARLRQRAKAEAQAGRYSVHHND
jgi:hypothetical protein